MLNEDKEYLLSLGAIFLEENIFYIPNFFDEDLLVAIKKEIDEEKEWQFTEKENGRNFTDMFVIKNPETNKKMQDIYEKFSQWPSFGKNFENVENFDMQDVKWVKKRGTGAIPMMGPHWDGDPGVKYVDPKMMGTMRVPNRVKWATVIYLNDNFEGGELNYLHLGITFKPIAGALIGHKGDEPKYRHSVNEIVGDRYNLIFNFSYGDVNEPEEGEEALDFKGKANSDLLS